MGLSTTYLASSQV